MAFDSRIGTEIAGYRIESLIGRGGMSVVYLAEHLRLGRKVALKLLASELAQEEGFRERFIRESRLAASLEHPNIIPIYDADESEGVLYIAMRYIEGIDFKVLIRREGGLSPEVALPIVAQSARGLDAAHARGLVHRDVKPGNILLVGDVTEDTAPHAYVCDFGLTKQALSVSGLTATGQFVGTSDYVAPEQIQGKPVDRRADVYSLGCVLYEALTGEVPFKRDAEVAVIWSHVQEPPPKVTDRRPDLPEGIDMVVARAMAKDPDDRYVSCGDLAMSARAELGVGTGEFAGLTGPKPIPTGLAPAAKRRRVPLILGGVAVVIAAVLAFLLLRPGTSVPPVTDHSLVRVDPASTSIAGVVSVGTQPASVAYGTEGLWVANFGEKTVQQIDVESETVARTSGGIPGNPTGMAVGAGSVWITNGFDGSLIKLDPRTLASIRIDVGTGASGVAVGEGAVWVVNKNQNTLVKVDPSSGQIAETVHVGTEADSLGPAAVATGGGFVWVSNSLGGSVWRFDPDDPTQEPEKFRLLSGNPGAMAFGEGALWVTDPEVDSITRIDANGQGPISCRCNNPVGIAVGEGGVWVASSQDGKLTRIDPKTRKVVTQVTLGFVPDSVAVSPGAVWVTVHGV
ncbi:MAG TPA: protein kinase [Actinomycetota bacterium]|nr:protein kinase [Actinomycetota bacterium]